MTIFSRIITRLSPPLPEVPPSNDENLSAAREAVIESSQSLVRAVSRSQAAAREAQRLREALSRNHLAPSFEMAMRRRGV